MVAAVLEIPAPLPRGIVFSPPLSDDEFENLCESCESAALERTKEGIILVNAPAGHITGDGNSEINHQLRSWWKQHRQGKVSDSSTGFFLPDGSSLSPDVAYVTSEQLRGLTNKDRARFLRRTPAFVIELRSPSDSLANCIKKMESWMANGVHVAWLIDPYAKQVHIYEQSVPPRIDSSPQVAGTGPVEGFFLDTEEVWRCYE
jgi:Uma2 family endonuclease